MDNLTNSAFLGQEIALDLAEGKLRSLKFRRWLKLREVALYLGEEYETIRKRVQRGKFPPPKELGGKKYWDRDNLDQLIESSGFSNWANMPVERRRNRWRLEK